MTNRTFALFMVSMMAIFVIIMFSSRISDGGSNSQMNHDRVKYLRDSLEMEYYKKQLESYPYDHSEIKDTTVIK
jgi:hypothetical protein